LDHSLSAHSEAEEAVFYTPLRDHPKAHDLVLEGFEEHAVVKTLLVELAALAVEDETWLPKFKVLKENVEHHVKEEEGKVFEQPRQIFSRARRTRWVSRCVRRRTRWVSRCVRRRTGCAREGSGERTERRKRSRIDVWT
jgi:hypothetical protein